MKIEILKKADTPSHTLKVGDVVDMRSEDAQLLIDDKKAIETKKPTDAEKAKKAKDAKKAQDAKDAKKAQDALKTKEHLKSESLAISLQGELDTANGTIVTLAEEKEALEIELEKSNKELEALKKAK